MCFSRAVRVELTGGGYACENSSTSFSGLVIICGVALTVVGHVRLSRLRHDLDQAEKPLGEFPVSDTSQIHLRKIPSPGPNSVAWRCFFPPRKTPLPTANHVPMVLFVGNKGGKQIQDPSGGWKRDDGKEFQLVVSFRWQPDGSLHLLAGGVGCGASLW